MSKLIRRKKEIGAALAVALQLTTLTLIGVIGHFVAGTQQSTNAPTASQTTAAPQAKTQTPQSGPAIDLSARRASAVRAVKLYEPRATQVFNLATNRAEAAEAAREAAQRSGQRSSQDGGELPNDGPTLTTNHDDYPPFSYVYIDGTGFQPGETVNMIVVELDPVQQSFQPWDVIADENGNISTSWYIFSEEFIGATLQVTATGQISQLSASATFTDASYNLYEDAARTINRDAFAWGSTVYARLSQVKNNTCFRVEWTNPGGSVVATHDLPGPGGNGNADRDDSFLIPAGPSGIWTAKIYSGSAQACTGTFTLESTLQFDVAHAVIVGAIPTGGVGGDNFVDQNNASAVQGVPPGAGTTLSVDSNSAKNKRTFVRFDLSNPPDLSGATVTSAKLRMLLYGTQNNFPRTHSAHRVTSTWLDSTITWSSPSPSPFDAIATDSQTAPNLPANTSSLIRWSVTSDVQGFVNSTFSNYGWCIKDATENALGNNNASYKSTEGNTPTDKTQGPVLLLDYTPPACTAVSVTSNPSNQSVTYGADATFTAAASGNPAPTIKWQVDTGAGFNDISGATSATLNITTPTVAMSGNQYRAVFTNTCNGTQTANSTAATLTVSPKTASVSADNASKSYGDDNPTFTATVTGTVNGDTLNYTLSTAAAKFSSVGDYPITVTLGSNPNYAVSKTDGTLHINPKTATVTANNKNKTYGDDNPALTATVAGTVNGDTLNYTLATTALKFSSVGDYPITVTLGSNPNYTVSKTDGTLHINAKAATVTADNKTKTYGNDNPALTATVSGTVNGDTLNYSLGTAALKFSSVGDYPITVTLGPNPNYAVAKTDGTLHIDPKAATVTADNKTKTYGDDNPALTAAVVGEVSGGDAINYSLSTTAAKFSSVGDYPITVTLGSNPNYSVTPNNGTLHIDPKAATVTAEDKTKTYGDDNPSFTAVVTGSVNGDTLNFTLGTTALKFSSVGDYPITVTLGSNPNYSVTPNNGTLHIDPKAATVTAEDKTKNYGDDNPSFTATVTGTINGDTLNFTLTSMASKFSNVGDYPITVMLGSNPNYSVTPNNGTLHIDPKTASVTANNKTKDYGDDNPALTATVVGEVSGGDAINYTLSTTAVKLSVVGEYPITVALGSNPNYTVSKTDGTLHIDPKAASVTANNKTKIYGDDNPGLTATIVGEVSGGDAINYSLSTAALKFSNVGDYPITVTLGSNPNYTVTPTDGTLHIDPKAATVTANNKTKTYGDDNPSFTATVTGTVNGDALDYGLSTIALKFSGVGDYVITVTLGSNPNYNVTPHNGNLHISPKDASVTADPKTKTYGDDNPSLTATVAGTVNGDTLDYSLSTTALKFSGVGDYVITVTLGSNPNYNVTPHNGNLHISPKGASVTADPKTKTYGDDNPDLTATVAGTVNGDTLDYSLSTTALKFSGVGDYVITVTLGSNPNYNVTPHNGNLHISPKAASVTADNKTKVYLAPNPTLTAMVTGTVNGDILNYTLSTTAIQTSVTGTYPITVTLGSNPNYAVTPHDGTLTIGFGMCAGLNPTPVILQPINADGSSVFKQGSTVPVKFSAPCDANGNPISNPMAVFGNTTGTITLVSAVRGTVDNVNENGGGDIPDVAFRYSSGIWIFNMATTNMTKNTTYSFRIPLATGGYINFTFGTK